jgi:hypothetical protein
MTTTISFGRNWEQVMLKRRMDRYKTRFNRLHYFNLDQAFDPAWLNNAAGLENFINWFDAQVKLHDRAHQHKTQALLVVRIVTSEPFGPDNCKLITRSQFKRQLKPIPVTNVLKTAVKEYMAENPGLTRKAVADHFKPYSYNTIREIINTLKKKTK